MSKKMKTIKYIKVLGLVAFLSATYVSSYAQEETTTYMNREMTLEREYDPSVQDANKVNTLPVVKEPEIRKIPIDYSAFTIPADPEKEIGLLSSGKIMTDMNYNKRKGYFNFAAGTYLNINGDFGYHILNTDKDMLNIFFSHRSTNGKVKYLQWDEKVKAKINDNLGGVNFRHYFDKATFKLGAQYGYSGFNYYGLPFEAITHTNAVTGEEFPPYLTVPDRKTNQVNQTIRGYIGVESKEEAPIGYMIDLDYTNFSYKYGWGKPADGPTEHTIATKFDLNIPLQTDQRVGISGKVNYFNYTTPENASHPSGVKYGYNFDNYAEVTLSPYYKINGGSWHLHLGVNAMFYTGDHKKFMASPNVLIDLQVADKTVLYAKATGKLQSNSLYEVSRINRYIDPTSRIYPTRNWLDGQIGLKSGVAPGFWFDIFGGYKVMSDDFFFMPNIAYLENDFGSRYNIMDNIDTKLLFVGLNLKYNYQKWFDINLKGVYNHWTADLGDEWDGTNNTEIKAYGRPKMEVNAGINIRPIDKVSIALDYYLATGRYSTHTLDDIKMKNINELNITGAYDINETFGAYVKLNNVLFQKYEMYYGYPLQKFSAMAGININF